MKKFTYFFLLLSTMFCYSQTVQVNNTANIIIGSGASLTCASLTLESSSTEYPSLILDGTINGTVSYSRYTNVVGTGTTGDNDLVSPPVSGQLFGAFASANSSNLEQHPSTPAIKAYGPFDNSNNTSPSGAYVNYNTGDDVNTELTTGTGYRAATDGSNLIYTGTVKTGDAVVTGDVTTPISIGTGSAWNLIGNPYPSYIRLDEFLTTGNIAIMDANSSGIYGYDGSATDGWHVWNQTYSDANPDALIAPGQGFMVKSASGGGNITFTPIMRSIGTDGNYDDFIAGKNAEKSNELSNTYAKIQISHASKTYNTDFYFNDNASLGLDIGYDASLYEATAPAFSIYSHLVEDNTGINMDLQSLNPSDVDNVTIPLGINTVAGKEIRVRISKSTLPAGIFVYLEDNVTGDFTLLNESDYTFTASEDLTSTGRFFISFRTSKVLGVEDELENFNSLEIYTSPTDEVLYIKGQITDIATLNLFDMQGRIVFTKKLEQNSNATQIDVAGFSTGIYIVQVKGNSIYKTKKIIIH